MPLAANEFGVRTTPALPKPKSSVPAAIPDCARQALGEDGATVADVAARYGFRSVTTFALEYRKRFGVPPSHARHAKA